MPRRPRTDDDVLDRLTGVFRDHGYDGASLSRISEATGLQRSSLYHRFPGGKDEMAAAVLRRTREWLEARVLAPLGRTGAPHVRVRAMAERIADFYENGRRSCLLETLSFGGSNDRIRSAVRQAAEAWIDAMAAVAREAGLAPATARDRAEDALIDIEGALVVSRVAGDTAAFRRVLSRLPGRLTEL